MHRPALFLDRDGVVNVEKNYLHRIEDFEFIPGVFDSCRHLRSRGYALVVVTNQAGIARGYYTEADYQALTAWMTAQFAEQGAPLDGVYHCPHHPEFSGPCSCRKPEPGMLLRAAAELELDLPGSILVGDKESDIAAGIRAGVGLNVRVRSGHPMIDESGTGADAVLDSIAGLPDLLASLAGGRGPSR